VEEIPSFIMFFNQVHEAPKILVKICKISGRQATPFTSEKLNAMAE
jgi:hypothetical protein